MSKEPKKKCDHCDDVLPGGYNSTTCPRCENHRAEMMEDDRQQEITRGMAYDGGLDNWEDYPA